MDEYRKYEPIFGSWYLGRLLGKGSFGKVFEITREEFGTTYRSALKIITVPQDEDDIKSRMSEGTDIHSVSQYYEGILREIINENEIMAQLKGNSNIVSYEDHQIIPHDDGIGYDILIRMELLTPLLDRMVERRLDEGEVVKLGIDMCKALETCHKKNIIHRDIKPQNIFISDNGDFKLGDFGIARTMEKTTGGMSKKGTYKYMAPEVFRGEHYDSTVDIYSLGIVLYSLLNGNRGPFLPPPPARVTPNDEEAARMRRFRGEPFPAPRDASPMLAYIIQKASAAYPGMRYQTAEEMRRDLESYQANYNSQAAQAFAPYAATAPDPMRQYTGQYTNPEQVRQYTGQYAAPDPMRQYTGQYTVPMQQPYGQGNPAADTRGSQPRKSSSSKLILIVAGILLVAVISALAVLKGFGKKQIDLSELMANPAVAGYDGYGKIAEAITVDTDKELDILADIKDKEKRALAGALIDSVVYTADVSEGLSNGDIVVIRAEYDEAAAAELGMDITGQETEVSVSGLEDLPDYLADAVENNGHFYKVVDEPMFWTQAKKACEAQNGHLATVLDAHEEAVIEDLIESRGTLYHYWLGASDSASEGNWKWVTGEKVPMKGQSGYQKWCGNQPNNKADYEAVGQDFMEIQKTKGDQGPEEYLTWTDIGDSGEAGERFHGAPDYNETRYYGYICEWDMQ
ncbi:MAG: protein kinase [Mogibacterium sp.]|nr:protein kinase [Mogibacterium sp.]